MAYSPFNFSSSDAATVCLWVQEELRKVAGELKLLEFIEYTAVPAKPFHGMRVIADGTHWNPGSGRGAYWYDSSTTSWKFMG